jgi:hypothetical protein
MYHAIVRRRVVALFAAVNKGDARPVLEGLAPRFEHFFLGDHALGGSRFTLEKTRLWYRHCKDCHEPVSRKRRLKKSKGSCAPSPRDRPRAQKQFRA